MQKTFIPELGVKGIAKGKEQQFTAEDVGQCFGGARAEGAAPSVSDRGREANSSGPCVGQRAYNETGEERRATIFNDGHAAMNGVGGQLSVEVFV